MTTKPVTTFRVPPATARRSGEPADPWAAARPGDVRVLTDRVVSDGHHDERWRAIAALRLAALLLDGPDGVRTAVTGPAVAVPAGVVRRLDVALPALLRSVGPEGSAPLIAVCAALGDRLSTGVCPLLQEVVRRGASPVAVAAHVASLLVEGLTPSAQHLADLTAIADPDPDVLAAHRHCPAGDRAAALAYAIALADRRSGGG